MLTIREALTLQVFANCKLVAGAAGLDNPIHWVHIVDIPEAHYQWQRRGVLLLTAGYGLRDDPEAQAALVPTLVRQGFAGMVLSTGYYFDEAPAVVRQAADENGFPVIEAPRELLFIEITETVLERIVNRQYALLQQSNRIHHQLTDLVLQGGTLHDLATMLAGILQRSITIESPAFRVLAAARHGPVDEARERTLASGRTTPELARRLLQTGIYDRLLAHMEPLYVAPRPELGMTRERFVAPIIVGREIHGYIWIIAGDQPLTDLDRLAIDHAATVAALIMFKEKAVLEAEGSLRGDFLERLLRGPDESAEFWEQARRLHFRPDRSHQVLLIHSAPETGGSNHDLAGEIEKWLAGQSTPGFLTRRDQYLVLVCESSDGRQGRQMAQRMVDALNHPAGHILVGVGQVVNGRLKRSYEGAQEALRIALMMGRKEGVSTFDELGLLHWLYHLPADAQFDNIYMQHVRKLAEYDNERNADLLKTMEVYLDQGGSLVEAAQTLYIHRNTLLHRLDRIEQLCPVDMRDPLHRLNLHAAIKSYRLHNNT